MFSKSPLVLIILTGKLIMIEFELDGKTVSAKPGSTILEVALQEGKYIPHFATIKIIDCCKLPDVFG